MPTAQQHEQSIINALRVTDPQLDTSLGTAVRKLISAVSLELSGYTTDASATTTLYALESVSGAELDYLVGQFGFSRQLASPARGTITISRENADSFLPIDYGSQFYVGATAVSAPIFFQTTAYQEMETGVTSAEISVIATIPGAIGNVAANTIKYSNGYVGYLECTNKLPTSGGRDAETDDELRKRFLATIFRNESGTRDQYIGLALAHTAVGRAKLIGQESHYTEITQVQEGYSASLVAERVAKEVEYYFPKKVWVRNTDTTRLLEGGSYEFELNPNTGETTVTLLPVDAIEEVGPVGNNTSTYQLDHVVYQPNNVVYKVDGRVISSAGLSISGDILTVVPDAVGHEFSFGDAIVVEYQYIPASVGDFLTVEFDYHSKRVRDSVRSCELFVDGNTPQPAIDIQYVDFDKIITAENQAAYQRKNGSLPAIGSLYIPLSHQPVNGSQNGRVSIGASLSLNEGANFEYIYDVTVAEGGTVASDGIELLGELDTTRGVFKVYNATEHSYTDYELEDETPISIPYYYNSVPSAVQTLTDAQSVVTMDTCVHQAARRRVGIYLTMMYSTFPRDTVAESAKAAIIQWSNNLQFDAAIQFSDIETVVANTGGVDNVRISTEEDAGGKMIGSFSACGIIEYARDGETVIGQRMEDFVLDENEVLDVMWVEVYGRAQSTW